MTSVPCATVVENMTRVTSLKDSTLTRVTVEPRSSSSHESLEGYLPGSIVKRFRGDGELRVQEQGTVSEIKDIRWNKEEVAVDVVREWDGGSRDETTITDSKLLQDLGVSHGWACYQEHLPHLGESSEPLEGPDVAKLEETCKQLYQSSESSGILKVRYARDRVALILLRFKEVTLPSSVHNVEVFDWLNVDECSFPGNRLGNDIANFKHITILSLANCGLEGLPNEIGDLVSLDTMFIDYNCLKQLPDTFGNLLQLAGFSVRNNQLESLPKTFLQLENLTIFWAGNNRFMTFPEVLCNLPKLERASFSDNRLRTVTQNIARAKSLAEISLDGNELQELPRELFELPKLRKLDVNRNPLQLPPLRVCRSGFQHVCNYFACLKGSTSICQRRKKVIVLGLSGAGKTSLIYALAYLTGTDPSSSPIHTVGVDCKVWQSLIHGRDVPLELYILDFGGHDVYYRMYPFFLADDDVVILAVNSRDYEIGCKDSFMSHIGQWIERVQSHTPGAQMLPVVTHTDCCPDVEEKVRDMKQQMNKLDEDYTKLLERKIAQTDFSLRELSESESDRRCELSEHRKKLCILKDKRLHVHSKIHRVSNVNLHGIDHLATELLRICEKSLCPEVIPCTWQNVLEVVVEERTNAESPFVKIDDLQRKVQQRIQQAVEVPSSDETQALDVVNSHIDPHVPMYTESALQYYHQLGDVLHYQHVDLLNDCVCVHPQRLADVYKQILSYKPAENLTYSGCITTNISFTCFKQMKESLLSKGVMDRKLFTALCMPSGNVDVLMKLLEHFCIAYPIDGYKKLLLPWLLPMVSKNCNHMLEEPAVHEVQLVWRFRFPAFYPDGFLEKLAVSCHRCFGTLNEHWKTGFYWKVETEEDNEMLFISQLLVVEKKDSCTDEVESDFEQDVCLEVVARVSRPRTEVLSLHKPILQPVCDIAEPVVLRMEELLKLTPGLVVERFVVCPRCSKRGLSEDDVYVEYPFDCVQTDKQGSRSMYKCKQNHLLDVSYVYPCSRTLRHTENHEQMPMRESEEISSRLSQFEHGISQKLIGLHHSSRENKELLLQNQQMFTEYVDIATDKC